MIFSEIIKDIETEPVTLAEAKVACKIDHDYDGEDEYLDLLIKSARMQLEKFTGRSFGKKTIKMYSDSKYFELLGGPVISIAEVTDQDGTVIDLPHPTRLHQRLSLHCSPVYVTYDAGYVTLPEPLKEAILKQVATNYQYRENLGPNGIVELANSAKVLAFPYSVNLVL